MTTPQFESILKELEIFFNCPLIPDTNNSCLIRMGIGISVQIEMTPEGKLLIGSRIATLPHGKFRENFIRATLKANDTTPPSTGVFGFSVKTNHLILFLLVDPNSLNPDKIFALLPPFIEKAKQWTEAAANGEIPVVMEQKAIKASTGGLFGLT